MRQQLRRWSVANHQVCQCRPCTDTCSGPAIADIRLCRACTLARGHGYPCHVPIPDEVIAQRAAAST